VRRHGPSRRAVAAGLVACLAGAARGQDDPGTLPPQVIVVSRDRILSETQAGRAIIASEREIGSAFQARVDAVKEQLEAEEAELTRLRGKIPRAEFESRATAFDRKVRVARRRTQKQAAELQQTFRIARERLVGRLAPILIKVLREQGAAIVLDADQILVAAPSVNMTEEVIRLFDEEVPALAIEPPEQGPLLPAGEPADAPSDGGD